MRTSSSIAPVRLLVAPPDVLPINELLQHYLTSSKFLTSNIWKVAISPCSRYVAIPKQDIFGHDCIVVLYCADWHSDINIDELPVHGEFLCSSTVWSLAFGRRHAKATSNIVTEVATTLTGRDPPSSRSSSFSAVNHRFDLTKNLFLAAGLADGKIDIWNVDTGELTLILADHRSTVCGLAFTSCTMQLASCSHDTTIKLWDLLDDGRLTFPTNFATRLLLQEICTERSKNGHMSSTLSDGRRTKTCSAQWARTVWSSCTRPHDGSSSTT